LWWKICDFKKIIKMSNEMSSWFWRKISCQKGCLFLDCMSWLYYSTLEFSREFHKKIFFCNFLIKIRIKLSNKFDELIDFLYFSLLFIKNFREISVNLLNIWKTPKPILKPGFSKKKNWNPTQTGAAKTQT
jgi:hypothetical protein